MSKWPDFADRIMRLNSEHKQGKLYSYGGAFQFGLKTAALVFICTTDFVELSFRMLLCSHALRGILPGI